MGRIFEIAKEKKIIDESPVKKRLLRNTGEKAGHYEALAPIDADRVKRLLSTLEVERQRLLIGLLAYTGMRPEEALGLRWEDVYLEKGYCDIVATVTYPDKSKPCLREATKTEQSERAALLPMPLVEMLKQVENKKRVCFAWQKRE